MSEQPPIQRQADDLAAEVHALTDRVNKDEADEVLDDKAALETRTTVDKMKDQLVWVCSGFFLLGAGTGYVVERMFA